MRLVAAATLALCLIAAPAAAQTRINAHHTVTQVSTASIIVRAYNALRSYLGLINDGSNTVWCRVDGQDAVANQGIRLNANGGSVVFDVRVPTGQITCIATTGTNAVLLTEGY